MIIRTVTICIGLLFFFNSKATMYQDIQRLPKIELHMHLGGSYPLEYLQKIATQEEFDELIEAIQLFVDGVDYTKAFFIFKLISRIVNTNQRVKNGTAAVCKALQADNVEYVEMRTSLKDLGSGYEDYLQSVVDGIALAQQDNFTARIILSVKRGSTQDEAQKTVDLAIAYKHKGVVGIDISDNSVEGDITNIIPILKEAKRQGLAILAHMGESPLEHDQMIILEHLEPDRIGHGVHLTSQAQAWILERKIPIEVCLSSSMCAKMINKDEQHPGLGFYLQGHPIIICTDDPLIFKTNISLEYALFAQQLGLTLEDVWKSIQQSYAYRIMVA